MMERKAFLANPKCQYYVSQQGEHDCNAHNKKNVDCFEYPSLTNFMDELNFKENGGKKSFSCKSKALISCILMQRT